MVDSGGSLEASMVFEKLFTDYLKSQDDEVTKNLLLRKLERLRKDIPALEGIHVEDNYRISVNIRQGSEYQVVQNLSLAFDSLMDVVAFSAGQEKAFKNAESIVTTVMKQFHDPFSRLGIKDHILKGAMAEFIPSGIEGLDNILGNGFPRSEMTLLLGPPGTAKYNFAFQFLAEGLNRGGAGVAVLSTVNVNELRERMSRMGVNVQSQEIKGRLKIVDWYSQKSRAVIGIEEHGSVLVPSKDIANLGIAFAKAIEELSFAPTSRAAVDLITPALNIYSLSDVIEFVRRQKSRFQERGIASLFVVEEGAHDERVMSTLKHLADGVLSLTIDNQGRMFIEIESMSNTKYRKGKVAVQSSSKGLCVTENVLDEANAINELCTIPLVTRDIAQRLVDAGFTDLEKLSNADQSELMAISLVNKEVAKSIGEYTRTVEYSQSVLSSSSEKWLKKAKEQESAGDLKRAQKSLERALEIDPSNAFAWVELSQVKKKLGEIE
ncbi:MAG: ATPase domain-containing protein [Thermoplasmata archaeon]|nr:ATPase domain-containing protein [Thermoplasmata archaeon]